MYETPQKVVLRERIAQEDTDEKAGKITALERLTCSEHKCWRDIVHLERNHMGALWFR